MRLKRGLKVLNRSVERGGFSSQSKALHLITGSAGGFILDTYVTSHTLIRQNSVEGRGLPNTYDNTGHELETSNRFKLIV